MILAELCVEEGAVQLVVVNVGCNVKQVQSVPCILKILQFHKIPLIISILSYCAGGRVPMAATLGNCKVSTLLCNISFYLGCEF